MKVARAIDRVPEEDRIRVGGKLEKWKEEGAIGGFPADLKEELISMFTNMVVAIENKSENARFKFRNLDIKDNELRIIFSFEGVDFVSDSVDLLTGKLSNFPYADDYPAAPQEYVKCLESLKTIRDENV